jgi:hypothetical protein
MTQHLPAFFLECTTITADGSLSTLDELEGLYVYWCSLRGHEPVDTELVLEALAPHEVTPATHDGVEYLEGLVLTGPVMADFIMNCEFTGAWGHTDPMELGAFQQVASA